MNRLIIPIYLICFQCFGSLACAEFDLDLLEQEIDVHGFVSQGFLKSEGNNFYFSETKDGTFQFNEIGLNVSTNLTDRLRVGLQLLSRDLGELGNNKIELDWAFGDYRWRDWLGFRAGKLKVSYGLYNDTRDIDMLRPFIFLPSSLYPEQFRDLFNSLYGFEFYGHTKLPALGNISYQVQYGEKSIAEDSAIVKVMESFHAFYGSTPPPQQLLDKMSDIDVREAFAGSLEWEPPFDGLRLKAWWRQHMTKNKLDARDLEEYADEIPEEFISLARGDMLNTWMFSAELAGEKLLLAAEYLGDDDDEEAYYLSAVYQMTDWWQLGVYYSLWYLNKNDKNGKKLEEAGAPVFMAWRKELGLTTRFDITESWIVKLEGHFINGTPSSHIQEPDDDPLKENSFLWALKTTFHF